ncbi:beta-amylase 2, chloroplastic-like [Bidens hawaiensis]|uniref:beta-amylase 2, chloroplastic-like n=1 Tax=Bidens hawaiensis TaxID=980011 RepID=UPI0040491FF9
MECELVDFIDVYHQYKDLESINVDGVTVVVWWGIVEADNPRQYNWSGYEVLFKILKGRNLKLHVVMAFHEYGGKDGDDVYIPLPKWIKEIGEENPDIYFTGRDGRRNLETLTWGIDEEHVLGGRTALEVYFEFMRSFLVEFDKYFKDGTITRIELCYDKYLRKCLEEAAEASRHSSWGSPPDNAGSYNSQPQDTEFFYDGGDYRSEYGKFFMNWYSRGLIDHADRVLAMAKMSFSEDTPIAVKLPGIHWWYKSESHAAELTAGYYNTANHNGYVPIASMLKKNQTTLNFICAELERFPEAMAEPGGLVSQVVSYLVL